ncbi:helix-turn-helix domain-containing protein [Actinomadura parmotrematis]|uniref:Helix-turn-helix domain-containing protein n=1 Tax=Actinomadura parmotrematis TaxID=2864039 RepID=A0ABS7FM22_9ACTN|nr:helix-turn-helix domain-containing protein [Actinomadura parmotrematis]MBW8481414.1 helix-turn-helix domain-containing protein [Actinomadura parmotrematis]
MSSRPRFLGPGGRMGTFTVDAGSTGTGRRTWEPFIDTWNDRMGDLYPLPEFSASTVEGFRGTMRSVALQDTAVNELWASSPVSTRAVGAHEHDQVRLYVGLRGAVTLRDPHDQGGDARVSAGTYFLHHCTVENHFHTTPVIGTRIFIFPGDALRALVAGRPRAGRATSPAAQILMAHTSTVQQVVGGLSPAGAQASRNALLELVKGLLLDAFDDREPAFTPALAQAARNLADTRLTDAELSPAAIAAHLHVSVRTLQRAFAETDEPLSAYIRRRRLEEAAAALLAPGSRLSVTEAAARWQFTDSSHFIRSFKKHYHATPAQFARRPA